MSATLRETIEHILAADPARAVEIQSRLQDARHKEFLSQQGLDELLQVITTLGASEAAKTNTSITQSDTDTRRTAKPDRTSASSADKADLTVVIGDRAKRLGNTSADAVTTVHRTAASADNKDDLTVVLPSRSDQVTPTNTAVTGTPTQGSSNGSDLHSDLTVVLPNRTHPVDATDPGSNSSADRTLVLNKPTVDIDVLSSIEDAQTSAAVPAPTAVNVASAAVTHEFEPGHVLKGRFELVSKLGEGGMGAVWKAKDKLKEEARDRNPFVAVKLLQGDFKDHPEAFIALQREASKQQRLAHPNIATVYDFDRDGETIYMTMEAMDGVPLDEFIRDLPAEGLAEEEAMVLIRDLCEGLAYAHRAGLVHSDLKPGNAFLVKDPERELGRIKLLDFGIARASSTKSDAEGEKTLFDPGQLGALTPTYATIEMFEGQDPDPRDDIYALAIIAYQLYTAKHPYDKKSAPKAKALGLHPAPIERLDKRQNRGVARALAFTRDARTPSVEEFLDDITRKKSRALIYSAAAALLLLVIGALAWGPVTQEIERREREEYVLRIEQGDAAALRTGLGAVLRVADEQQRVKILADGRVRERVIALLSQGEEPSIRDGLELIREPGFEALKESIKSDARAAQMIGAFIARGDEQSIRTGLKLIEPFDPNWQRVVKDQQTVKNAIIEFYTRLMYSTIDPSQGKYGYTQAAQPLKELEKIYPDSAEVFQVRRDIETHKSKELAQLRDRYTQLLDAGNVLRVADADDISDVLAIVAAIDDQQAVLTDVRIPVRFAELARESMRANDFNKAKELILASTEYAANDPTLLRLGAEVDAQLEREAAAQQVADITSGLSDRWRAFDQLADFEAVSDDLATLAKLAPHSELLAMIPTTLQRLLDAELTRLRAAKNWQLSEILFRKFARFLSVPFVVAARAQLSGDEALANYQPSVAQQQHDTVSAARSKAIESLLTDPKLTARWALEVRSPLNDLIALLPADDTRVLALRDRLARHYIESAQQARQQQRFDAARNLLADGKVFSARVVELNAEDAAISRDEAAAQARREEQARVARISALQTALIDKAAANETIEAERILAQLSKELAADDPLITRVGPRAIGEAYLRRAKSLAQQRDVDAAASQVASGLVVAPFLESLQLAQGEYRNRQLELATAAQLETAAGTQTAAPPSARLAAPGENVGTSIAAMIVNDSVDQRGVAPLYPQASTIHLTALRLPTRAYRPQVLPPYPSLTDGVADTSARKIVSFARSVELDLVALEQPLAGFAALYPKRAQTLLDDVVKQVEDRVRELVQRTPIDVLGLRVPLDAHARLFADRHATLKREIIADLERLIIAYTQAQPLDIGRLATPLTQFANVFPEHSNQLRAAVAERLESSIEALAKASAKNLTALEAPMSAYQALYPQRHGELADKVGGTIATRLAALKVDTIAKLAALEKPLARFKALFSQAYPSVRKTLSEKSAAAIQTLLPKDIYAADKLRRAALKALPGSAAIAAIRIELPLQEIIDANKLLATGKLTAAMKKLNDAIKVDAEHSDIKPFKQSLQARTERAQADYDRYVRYTAERKDRNERKKLFANATRGWSDNASFVILKAPRSGSCMASLAGHGRAKRSTCYDLLPNNAKGPVMVVLPAGKFKKAFAIGKYEVMADHFNRFCKSTKTCKSGSARGRKLPVTGVSLAQAKAYAEWVSKLTTATQGSPVVYRLPTTEEWAYAAAANGQQPKQKSFNCRVSSGGNIIKGHALLNANTGKENGWGLVNHIGNARELATSGATALALGGAFEDSLTNCGVDTKQPHSGTPDALTGFRLVREISG